MKWIEEYKNRPEYSPPSSGGGMFSTLSDLHKFAAMILNKGQYKIRIRGSFPGRVWRR